jgi:PAS domain S-box-containing protein
VGRNDNGSGAAKGTALAQAVLEISQARDLPELMLHARAAVRTLTGADGATLVLREGDHCRYADEDAIGSLWKGRRFPLADCISGWVMQHDEAVIIDDIYADPRIHHEFYRTTFVQSLSMTPIRRGKPLGVIGCYWAHRYGADAAALHVQQFLADAMALAFENMEIRRRLVVARKPVGEDPVTAALAAAIPAAPGESKLLRALRESEARYRGLVEQAPDGIFFADREGRFLDANEVGARMLGYSREEIRSRCIADVVVPEEVHRIPLEVARVSSGKAVTSEWSLLRKNGTTFPGEVVGRRLPDGRLQGILRDVSERLRAEAALRDSESFYRQTLESIPGMVFTTRPDGYCDYQSQQWVDYTGVPMEEHLGDGWNELLHPEDRARALNAWRNAVAERAPYDLEYRVRRHDGVYELFRVVGRPIRDESCRIVRWFGVGINIERRKRAEDQRIAALERQRDTLVREVHHRIKNHLQGVTGLLRSAISDTPQIARPLEKAIAQIHAVAGVHGLQSRGDSGRLPVCGLIHTAAGSAPGAVWVSSPGAGAGADLFVVGDDAVAISLIINELITNAVKHRQINEAPDPVQVIVQCDAGTARIAIRSGPARLPPDFDFARRTGVGNGLELVSAMLPTRGAALVIRQAGDDVEAVLILHDPVVAPS